MALSRVLHRFYYLENYHYLLNFVEEKSGSILSEKEKQFIIDFRNLPKHSQAFYVRMFNRSGLFFNVEKFNYPEIKSIRKNIRKLESGNFISNVTGEEVDDVNLLLKIFTKEELLNIFNCYSEEKVKKSIKRDKLLYKILAIDISQLIELINEKFSVIKQKRAEEADMIRFLFFGSADYDMTEFVIRDIGNADFENYDEKKLSSYFTCRKEAEDKWKITNIYKQYRRKREEEPVEAIYDWFKDQPLTDLSESAQPIFNKLVNKLGYDLERSDLVNEALEVYSYTSHYPSRERRIRILSKQNKTDEALELCKEILDFSSEPKEKLFALDFSNKNGRAYRQTTKKLNGAHVIEISIEFEGRVELGAMKYFSESGYNSFFSENYLWRTIFGLLFWEIIYDVESGAIHNPLQRAPSDFYSQSFFEKRNDQISELISRLENKKMIRKKIKETWKDKYGKVNPLFGWDNVQIKMMNQLIKFLKPEQLHKVLHEMLKNIKSNCTGFPDLFVFNKKEYFFAEIKSPNDHLSDQQLFWMYFFEEININLKLLRVKWY